MQSRPTPRCNRGLPLDAIEAYPLDAIEAYFLDAIETYRNTYAKPQERCTRLLSVVQLIQTLPSSCEPCGAH